MHLTIDNETVEQDNLDQMRDLVVRVTSGLDCTVFLFGSRERGEYRRGSDADIDFSGLSELLFTKGQKPAEKLTILC